MKVKFWGTRGSIPVSLTAKDINQRITQALLLAYQAQQDGHVFESPSDVEAFVDQLPFELTKTYGGHSSCVQIDTGSPEYVLCDLGTGVRAFGQYILGKHGGGNPQIYHVFMSHVHWDHIMGFPFFAPAYIPGNKIIIHGCHTELEHAFRRQQKAPSFPVNFSALGSSIEFDVLQPDVQYHIAGLTVRASEQHHEGQSFGWRFEHNGKSVIYATDSEHKLDDTEGNQKVVEFFDQADLVIFDAMYSLAEAISIKADWGHSSNIMGVELCQRARAKTLAMFHHEPAFSDAQIYKTLKETVRFEELTRLDGASPLNVLSTYDGLEIAL